MPSITVLMSVYNSERWLKESLSSVLNQTFTDFEFIIVNDGSTDSSSQIIDICAREDRRIRVVIKQNTGLADSLNQGIQMAKGEWIARIDADDFCEPNRLEVQYDFAKSHPSLILIGSGLTEINEWGKERRVYNYPNHHKQLLNSLIRRGKFFAHSSALYRTATVRRLGGYRPRIKRAQDRDLWLRLSEVGEMACINEPLVCIRKHAEQISLEDCGLRQLIDSNVALVSYYLRQKGYQDPVSEIVSTDDYLDFWRFIEEGIKQDGLAEYLNFIRTVKQKLSDPSLNQVFAVLALTGRFPHFVLRYVMNSIYGESLSQRLVNNWIEKNKQFAEFDSVTLRE